jgi:hypothetical protein
MLAGVLLSGCSVGSEASFDGEAALSRVEDQVAMGPRFPGSQGHAALQEWLALELGRLGWQTESQSFDYLGTTLTNFTAHRGPAPGPLILLAAHYDTRRFADRDPTRPSEPVPGANDGASGVAVLLELARLFGEQEPLCDLRLVFFDGEDNGGIDGWEWAAGSRHYAAELTRQPLAVVVVDMVGDRDLALPIERTSSPDLAAEIWSAAGAKGLTAFRDEPGPAVLDDHSPFLERGWRAVDIIDLSYPAWHTVEDTPDEVSADSDQVGEASWRGWRASACHSKADRSRRT